MPSTDSEIDLSTLFEEQEQLGLNDEELTEWLESKVTMSGGMNTFEPREMKWILSKFHELLGKLQTEEAQ